MTWFFFQSLGSLGESLGTTRQVGQVTRHDWTSQPSARIDTALLGMTRKATDFVSTLLNLTMFRLDDISTTSVLVYEIAVIIRLS